MEMQASGLIAKFVVELYSNLFADISCDGWERPLPVDANHRPGL